MNEYKSPIPSMLYNAAVGGHVTSSQQIIDENLNREQNDINQETVGTIPYNSTNPNGMGRVVLKKNDNFKEVVEAQTNGNTIFVIKYDFILTGDVTIPVNCILQFDGGSISGAYTITGNNTSIEASLVKIFNINVTFAGSWNVAEAYPEWFGAKGDGITDDTIAIQKCINSFSHIVFTGRKIYEISSSITVSNKILEGKEAYGYFPNIETKVAGITMFVSDNFEFKRLNLIYKNISDTNSRIIHITTGGYIYNCYIVGGYDTIYCDKTCDGLVIDKCTCWSASGHAWLNLNISNDYLAAGIKIMNCHLNFANSLDDPSMKYGLILHRCEQCSIENCIINQADISILETSCREISHFNIHIERNDLPSQLTKAEESLSVSAGDYLYNNNFYGIIYKILSEGTINTLTGWSDTIGEIFTIDGVSIQAYKSNYSVVLSSSANCSFTGVKFSNLCSVYLQGSAIFTSCTDYGVVNQGFYIVGANYKATLINCDFNYDVKLQYDNKGKVNYIQSTIGGIGPINKIIGSEWIETISSSTLIDLNNIKNKHTKYYINAASTDIDIRIPVTDKYHGVMLTFIRTDDSNHIVSINSIYSTEYQNAQFIHTVNDSITIGVPNIGYYGINVIAYGENIVKRYGSTSNRPSLSAKSIGFKYFDTDLTPARPIYWNGTSWVDAAGVTV